MKARCGRSPTTVERNEDMAEIPSRALPDALLMRDEVAAWLKVRPRQVERLGVPSLDLGRKTKRYLTKDVLTWLEERRDA